jgi:UTP--glucose-1-phosphate uridylyltransferase
MKGDGHALLQARDWVKKGTVAVLFGDDLIVGKENGLQQMVKAMEHLQGGGAGSAKETAMLCLQEVEKKFLSRYGVVELDEKHAGTMERLKKVKGMVEKPKPEDAPSNFGIVGKYLIPSSLFERLHEIEESAKDGEVRLIDALIHHKKNLDIYGYVFEGTRLDTGHPEGYKEAVKMLG